MIAEKDNVVSIVYELRTGSHSGEVVETITNDNPLVFLFGQNGLLPKFQENLKGLSEGDSFEFLLNSENAYGPVVENAIVQVPKTVFEVDGKVDDTLLKVGNTVPMMDAEGNRLNGTIIEIETEGVKMDFNHPMAGSDLYFTGEVIAVRLATDEELSKGHVKGDSDCGSCDDPNQQSCNCG